MKPRILISLLVAGCLGAVFCPTARAESQGDDYKGVSDPFGDPTNYEFSEDEKEDKEFFHLGRYVMIGLDLGAGIYTGGLGASNTPGFYVGGHLIYFFDRQVALEAAVHYSNSIDTVNPNQNQLVQINTDLIPITLAFRFYFDTKNAPKAIAVANPYLVAGGGLYIRSQSIIQNVGNLPAPSGSTNSFGGFAGGGVEFAIYGRHTYLGIDLRYHLVFWPDANDTFGGVLPPGSRGGGYTTAAGTLTYNF
jgi:hypothetical protein